MTVVYQGGRTETDAADVAAFLAVKGVDVSEALVEYRGDVYAAGSDLAALPIVDGAELNVFRVVAGG